MLTRFAFQEKNTTDFMKDVVQNIYFMSSAFQEKSTRDFMKVSRLQEK